MSEPADRPNRILIVDDNANNIAILFDALQNLGYELRVARDGLSALEKVACEPPDLILLDVMMPGIDGFETCAQLKADPASAAIPVIFMTGMGEVEDKVKGFAVGGVDYLVKPVRLPELQARLATHLNLKHLQHQLQRQNRDLAAEVERRQQVEAALREAQADLERKVAQRTEELRATNDVLAQKIQALQVAEADLQQALLAARAAAEAKSQFLAKMSHELRTPLNAILGFSQLLAGDGNLSPQQRQQITIIEQSGDHLLRLIADILSVVQLESGDATYVPSPISLRSWLHDLIAPFQSRARAKGLTCELELADNLPGAIATDAAKLQQVLWHLLDNAIKFASSGGARLCVRSLLPSPGGKGRVGMPETDLQLCFAVEDTGPGFATADLQQWFEPFAQTRSNRESLEGTGIGLTIAQRVVQLLGGELQVTSTPGQGSCFCFSIPVALPAPASEPAQPVLQERVAPIYLGLAPDQPTYSLLVAAEPVASRRLFEFLTPLGFAVEFAPSLAALLERWQALQPHLLVVEATPAAGEAIAAIRAAAGQATVPVVALLDEAIASCAFPVAATLPVAWQETALLETLATCLGARYLYRQAANAQRSPEPPLQAEDLRGLSPAWLQEFQSAVSVVDDRRVRGAIAQLGPERDRLRRQLNQLADNFRFDVLLELVQAAAASPSESAADPLQDLGR